MKELKSKDISRLVAEGRCLYMENGKVYEIKKGHSKVSRIRKFFSLKKHADRYMFGFRGVSVACSPITLIQAYEKEPVTEEERVELVKLASKKDNKFFIELLNTHSEIALDIMNDCLPIHVIVSLYRQWLVESQQYITEEQAERLVDIRLERSQNALEIVTKAFLKAEEMKRDDGWITDHNPTSTGFYQCTVIDKSKNERFVIPMRFSKDLGVWCNIDGEPYEAIAWKLDKPYEK